MKLGIAIAKKNCEESKQLFSISTQNLLQNFDNFSISWMINRMVPQS